MVIIITFFSITIHFLQNILAHSIPLVIFLVYIVSEFYS